MKKMDMEERITQAQSALQRVQGIGDVYTLLLETYHSRFCVTVKDEDGNYVMDEDGNFTYKEKAIDEDTYCYPFYDEKREVEAHKIFNEVLDMVASMK